MGYRDDLEASQHRIRELEDRVRELEADKAGRSVETGPEPSPSRAVPAAAILGVPTVVVLIAGAVLFGSPACTRALSAHGELARSALRSCPRAKERLGEDVDFSTWGCANCESEGGGDPTAGGCSSTSTFEMPVAGRRGRGTLRWNTSKGGGKESLDAVYLTVDGESLDVLECSRSAR